MGKCAVQLKKGSGQKKGGGGKKERKKDSENDDYSRSLQTELRVFNLKAHCLFQELVCPSDKK